MTNSQTSREEDLHSVLIVLSFSSKYSTLYAENAATKFKSDKTGVKLLICPSFAVVPVYQPKNTNSLLSAIYLVGIGKFLIGSPCLTLISVGPSYVPPFKSNVIV